MRFSAAWDGTIVVAAFSYGTLVTVASMMPFVGMILGLLFWLSLIRYAYSILLPFAQGHRNIPPPDFETVNPFNRFSLLLHFVAFPASMAAAGIYLPGGVVVGLLIASLFPASAALIGITGRLESAFSPSAICRTIGVMGSDYVSVGAAAIVIALGGALIANLMAGGGLTSLFVTAVIEAWIVLATFALIGAAVHAHRLDFDVPGEVADPEERFRADREREWRAVLDQAYASLRGGRPQAGYRALRQFLEQNADSPQAHYWLVENLFDWENKAHAVAVATRLVAREIEHGRLDSALQLWRRCRRVGERIDLPAADIAALAAFARSIGQQGMASELESEAGAAGPDPVEVVGYNERPTKTT